MLTVSGLAVDGLVLDNVPLTSAGGTIGAFDNVTFQGYAGTATQFTISHPGAASPFTFDGVSFTGTPTTGYYVDATDTAPTDGLVFTINLTNSVPGNGTPFTMTTDAAVNWSVAVPVVTWVNPVSGNWSDPANWSTAAVPQTTDDVGITVDGNYTVTLDVDATVASLTLGGGTGGHHDREQSHADPEWDEHRRDDGCAQPDEHDCQRDGVADQQWVGRGVPREQRD